MSGPEDPPEDETRLLPLERTRRPVTRRAPRRPTGPAKVPAAPALTLGVADADEDMAVTPLRRVRAQGVSPSAKAPVAFRAPSRPSDRGLTGLPAERTDEEGERTWQKAFARPTPQTGLPVRAVRAQRQAVVAALVLLLTAGSLWSVSEVAAEVWRSNILQELDVPVLLPPLEVRPELEIREAERRAARKAPTTATFEIRAPDALAATVTCGAVQMVQVDGARLQAGPVRVEGMSRTPCKLSVRSPYAMSPRSIKAGERVMCDVFKGKLVCDNQ